MRTGYACFRSCDVIGAHARSAGGKPLGRHAGHGHFRPRWQAFLGHGDIHQVVWFVKRRLVGFWYLKGRRGTSILERQTHWPLPQATLA